MGNSAFVSGAVRVIVPASSANLGPGFDSMGLAIEIHDEITAIVTDDQGLLIEVEGEGQDEVPRDESHLVAQAMNLGFEAMGHTPSGFILKCRNAIPHSRGLGSSAAAIIGGLVLARAMVNDGENLLPDSQLLNLALRMENHPDNLSAALFGGFTVSWLESESEAGSVNVKVHENVIPIVLIPPHGLATSRARSVLPTEVPMSAATHNLARAGLLVHAMTSDPSYLLPATSDRIHQDARADMYPETTELINAIRSHGVAAVASGAGPAVLILINKAQARELESLSALVPKDWTSIAVPIDRTGARRVALHS
jgi:homoserine kinase